MTEITKLSTGNLSVESVRCYGEGKHTCVVRNTIGESTEFWMPEGFLKPGDIVELIVEKKTAES